MLILYVAMKYDYGKPEQGYSFEHYNFYDSLHNMGHDILYFDFMTLMNEHGRDWMNRRLLEVAKVEKPDLLFCILFHDELSKNVMKEITENTDTTTLNWFCDDHWRFDDFSGFWAPYFNWVVTTARLAMPKYEKLGYRNVIKSQWACNHFLYRKLDLQSEYDVTFIGQSHGNRRAVLATIRDAGIKVDEWGTGWESGRLSQKEMIRVFNQSRINLNLPNASTFTVKVRSHHKSRIWNLLSHSLEIIPFGVNMKDLGKELFHKQGKIFASTTTRTLSENLLHSYPEQIKGRNFEIPGCGGFLLTGHAENLEDYYEVGKEVACFEGENDLIDKVMYYLRHDDERLAIAQAGYERTLHEHTYAHRFDAIFNKMSLPCDPLDKIFEGKVPIGKTEEVH